MNVSMNDGEEEEEGKKKGQDVNGNQLYFQRSQIEANFFFSSMYRLLVPAHILSAKRALYHQCSWFVWMVALTNLLTVIVFVVVVHPPVRHFVYLLQQMDVHYLLRSFSIIPQSPLSSPPPPYFMKQLRQPCLHQTHTSTNQATFSLRSLPPALF